jgi:hypothetical protein
MRISLLALIPQRSSSNRTSINDGIGYARAFFSAICFPFCVRYLACTVSIVSVEFFLPKASKAGVIQS